MKLFLSLVLRESRGSRGRMLFFTLCLAVGVAAVVGVAALISAVETGIRAQSQELLAADLVVDSRRPLPEETESLLAELGAVEQSRVIEMATMVSAPARDGAPGASRLAELKVTGGRFPLYGSLGIEPDRPLEELLDSDSVVVGPELVDALGVAPGGSVSLGGATFRIAGVVHQEPTRLGFNLTLGPRVFLSTEGLARTQLLGFGNRVRYRALARMEDSRKEALRQAKRRLRQALPGASFIRIEIHTEAQPTVRRGLRHVERFLGLVALLSLLLGGIGVAQIVRAWLASRTTSTAVLRCMGFRPRDILWFYLGHVALLALVGSAVGAVLGLLLPLGVSVFAADSLPREFVDLWQPVALLRGLGLGVTIALVFSLPPLTAVWRVPPARVLRSDVEPLRAPVTIRVLTGAALVGGVSATAWGQSEDARVALAFTGVLFLVAGLLTVGAWGAMRLTTLFPRERWSPYLFHGLAALARPGMGTTGAIVALGLGVLVVFTMFLVERRLADELENALPATAPSSFMVDVQPQQWDGVRGILTELGATGIDSVPVVMARLSEIDGVSVEKLARERRKVRDRSRWTLTREQRLTWRAGLADSNTLVRGEFWTEPGGHEVSIEEGYAEDLGVDVGSRIVLDIQGIPMELEVTSIRAVEWESFQINFFLQVPPGVLEDAPHFRIAAARVTEAQEIPLQNRLAAEYPNVTVLHVRTILEKIVAVLERLAFGVRALGSFTIFTGLLILAGSVSSTQLRRRKEAALLKTLGVTRAGVVALMATEFALGGLVAGTVGGAGALAIAWGFLDRIVQIEPALPLLSLPLTILATAALAIVFGVGASLRALAARPLESLRD